MGTKRIDIPEIELAEGSGSTQGESLSKVCSACNVRKSSSEFYPKGKGRSDSRCKDCVKQQKKSRYRKSRKSSKTPGVRQFEFDQLDIDFVPCENDTNCPEMSVIAQILQTLVLEEVIEDE